MQGQLLGLQALVLALADAMPKEEFRERALAHLERAKTALFPEPVSETRLQGFDSIEETVRRLTK